MTQRIKFNMLRFVNVIIWQFCIFVRVFAEDVVLLSGDNWMVTNDEKGRIDLLDQM